jgi:spermidine/putrescine transport system permease protein
MNTSGIDKAERKRKFTTAMLLLPATAWYAVLLLMPLVFIIVFSFGERGPAGGYVPAFTLENYLNLPTRSKAFFNTMTLAPIGTIACLLIAFPLAYYLALVVKKRYRNLLLVLVIVPFWTSLLVRTYAWIFILSGQGLPKFLGMIGFDGIRMINTPGAVLIGIIYIYLPLMVFPIYVSLEKLDTRLLEASSDLGAPPFRTFLQVTLPLSIPGIATGSMMVFILLMGEFIIPQMLGGGKVYFIGNALVDVFLQSRNWPFGAAFAATLVAIMLVTITVYMRFMAKLAGGREDVSVM